MIKENHTNVQLPLGALVRVRGVLGWICSRSLGSVPRYQSMRCQRPVGMRLDDAIMDISAGERFDVVDPRSRFDPPSEIIQNTPVDILAHMRF